MKNAFFRILLVFGLMGSWGIGWGQCPSGDVVLDGQVDVDNFVSTYPNCTEINGYLQLTGNINDISGLNQLERIESFLLVSNSNIPSLEGLENLEYIGSSLGILFTENLNNLSGLSSLDTIVGNLDILFNENLTSLNGILSLDSIGGYFRVESNPKLVDITSLSTVNINGKVYIEDNPLLSNCNVLGICSNLSTIKRLGIISGNASGCNSQTEILLSCGFNGCVASFKSSSQNEINNFNTNFLNCDSLTGELWIQSADVTDLSPLSNITSIGYNVRIGSTSVTNLSGLSNVTFKSSLYIYNNNFLPNLNDISNATFAPSSNSIYIQNNPQLSSCGVTPICDFLGSGGNATISSNSSGCNTQAEVENDCLSALPVELTTFKAKLKNNSTELHWQTATETNNYGFQLQKSKDAISWEDLAFIEGQGTSSLSHEYEYTDARPYEGFNYYRLQQIDLDGKYEYSEVIAVEFKKQDAAVSVFPNPARESIFIKNYNNTISDLQIVDLQGKVWSEIRIDEKEEEINISSLPNGIYFFKSADGNFFERFVKF